MNPYKLRKGQKLSTDVPSYAADRAFLAHIEITSDKAQGADTDGILPVTNLGAEEKSITEEITNPGWPRNVTITGNVSGINGKVKIYGTNFRDEIITEELTANGSSTVTGSNAFKTITKIDLPAQVHTPTKQKATVAVLSGASGAGEVVLTFTAAILDDSKDITVAVTTDDNTTAEVAEKIADALNADDDFSAHFTAESDGGNIIIEANEPDAQDNNIDLEVKSDGDNTGVTLDEIDPDTVSGVPYDQISVGWGEKLGLPYFLTHNTIFAVYLGGTKESDAPTVAIDDEDIHKNTIDLNSSLSGDQVDIYLIV